MKKEHPLLEPYIRSVRDYRGEIIGQAVLLERFIDFYIAFHFCKKQELINEFLDLIICTDRITFGNKLQVFKFLIEKHDPEFFKANPKFYKDVLDIIEKRNIFAHYHSYAAEDALELFKNGVITFIKFKNDRTFVRFTKEEIISLSESIVDRTSKLRIYFKEKHGLSL